MSDEQLQQLAKLREQGILSEEMYQAAIARIPTAGATAVGDGATALGSRAVQTEGNNGLILTGDGNHIQQIIQQTKLPNLTVDQLQKEVGRYLNWLYDHTSHIELRGIKREGQQVVQLPLHTVYVPLAARTHRYDSISLNRILSLGNRLIILGGPGSGKTTVLLHLAYALCKTLAQDDINFAKKHLGLEDMIPLPILVPLSLFAAYWRDLPAGSAAERSTLAAFISHYLVEKQTNFALPSNFFQQLLRQGEHVLLLLDGLDEVANEDQRAMVRQAIEDLVKGRPNLRVVVTCRPAAYRERSLLGQNFQQLKVLPLTSTHIHQMVTQAYAEIFRQDIDQQTKHTTDLLTSIDKLEKEREQRSGKNTNPLVETPLMVRMLLIVHYSERKLPDQRAELYAKATDAMLLPDYLPDAQVTEQLGHLVAGNKDQHRDLVQYLAYHMHDRGKKAGREIGENALRNLLSAKPEYKKWADDFIAVTRTRGTLMEERQGEYRFLHLAFQEFLAARYLAEVKNREVGMKGLACFIEESLVSNSWWREPILLLVGYLSQNATQAATDLLKRLSGIIPSSDKITDHSPERWMAMALAAFAAAEWHGIDETVRNQLTKQIVCLLTNPDIDDIAQLLRAEVGRGLSMLGDPRPWVGLKNGLPDIAWSKELPAGTYTIGDERHDDQVIRNVTIAQPYCLARYPITQAQFTAFEQAGDWADKRWWRDLPKDEKQFSRPGFPYANHPQERVSWYQAVAFCRWLNEKLVPTGYEISLPTEEEWEVAARYRYGKDYPQENDRWDDGKAKTDESNLNSTTAVGIYPQGSNTALGLYDMSGNVFEWCLNKYDHPNNTTIDQSNDERVLRGGSWSFDQAASWVAVRHHFRPYDCLNYIGLRPCLRKLASG